MDLNDPTLLLYQTYSRCTQREWKPNSKECARKQELVRITFLSRHRQTITWLRDSMPIPLLGHVTRKGMRRNVWKDDSTWQIRKSSNYTKSPLRVWMNTNSKMKNWEVGEFSKVYSHIAKTCPAARIGRPDKFWSVNYWARAITRWNKACEKRLARLISYIHLTTGYRQCCHVGNAASECRLGLFQDASECG